MARCAVLFFVLLALGSSAQQTKHAFAVELGGGGLLYSLNYERSLTQHINARAGGSFLVLQENGTDKGLAVLSFPLSAAYRVPIGATHHSGEAGIGIMNLLTRGDLVEFGGATDLYLNPFLIVGYRYHNPSQRMSYRVAFTPFLGTKSAITPTEQGFAPLGRPFQLWGSIGIGYHW